MDQRGNRGRNSSLWGRDLACTQIVGTARLVGFTDETGLRWYARQATVIDWLEDFRRHEGSFRDWNIGLRSWCVAAPVVGRPSGMDFQSTRSGSSCLASAGSVEVGRCVCAIGNTSLVMVSSAFVRGAPFLK